MNVFTLTIGALLIAACAIITYIEQRFRSAINDLREAVMSMHAWIEEYDRRLRNVEYMPWPESEERWNGQLAESPFIKDRRPPQ